MARMHTAIGLMSGTSLDGIDAAIVRSDGHKVELTDHFITVDYKPDFRERLRDALGNKESAFPELERDLTNAHAGAVTLLLDEARLKPGDIDVIGFHGQTVFHAPDKGITRQLGDGNLLAKLTGINVVNDFRSNDIKSGGQGAPLAPLFHLALLNDEEKPVVALNIGGVANVSFMPDNDENNLIAFDTGPGNALINDWVFNQCGVEYDDNGTLAASGSVNTVILEGMLSHPYFKKRAPKSLDRNAFPINSLNSLSPEDGAATLTAFTVQTIVMAKRHFPSPADRWFVFGGGRHNSHMISELKKALGCEVLIAEDIGLNGDATEAQAFAYFAVRSLEGLPLTFPGTTGVKSAATGGVFCRV